MKVSELMRDAAGFSGRFEFVPEHEEDHGHGYIADVVFYDDELVYFGEDDEKYVISDCIEQHVAEPIARMLNAVHRHSLFEGLRRCDGHVASTSPSMSQWTDAKAIKAPTKSWNSIRSSCAESPRRPARDNQKM